MSHEFLDGSELESFASACENKTALHAGYPYNLNYDFEPLLRFFKYSLNNLGDPYIASNYAIDTRAYEQSVIAYFAELFELTQDHWGYVTTSGTEGNLYAMVLGRQTLGDPILYYSADTHYSVPKAAGYFRIDAIKINSLVNGEIDYDDFEQKLDKSRPALVNVNIGTTLKGAVDNVDRVIEILDRNDIRERFIHCDGALGGMLVPFLRPNWLTFKKGIDSIAISGHKFIGNPFPCGIVLTKAQHVRNLEQEIEYIGSRDTTIGGSRNGHAPLFLWYAISNRRCSFGKEALLCRKNAEFFVDCLLELGVRSLLNDCSTTVLFPNPGPEAIKKFQLASQGEYAHVVVMQNHTRAFLRNLAMELSQAITER